MRIEDQFPHLKKEFKQIENISNQLIDALNVELNVIHNTHGPIKTNIIVSSAAATMYKWMQNIITDEQYSDNMKHFFLEALSSQITNFKKEYDL